MQWSAARLVHNAPPLFLAAPRFVPWKRNIDRLPRQSNAADSAIHPGSCWIRVQHHGEPTQPKMGGWVHKCMSLSERRYGSSNGHARESAYPVAVRLPCRCSLLPLRSMLSHHLNASLKSYHLLQTLMIEHASHLCVRSSHQAIHYASALVSAVASAASCFFFHRRQEQELFR